MRKKTKSIKNTIKKNDGKNDGENDEKPKAQKIPSFYIPKVQKKLHFESVTKSVTKSVTFEL